MADWKVAETVATHEGHAGFQVFVHADGKRIISHDLGQAGTAGIPAFGDDAPHEVSFGKDPNQLSIMENRHGADVLLHHDANGFEYGMAEVCLKSFLILNQVADTHLTPPGERSSELFKSIYRGVSICRKGDVGKAKKGDRKNFWPRMGAGSKVRN
jgi:hypothetical protein